MDHSGELRYAIEECIHPILSVINQNPCQMGGLDIQVFKKD